MASAVSTSHNLKIRSMIGNMGVAKYCNFTRTSRYLHDNRSDTATTVALRTQSNFTAKTQRTLRNPHDCPLQLAQQPRPVHKCQRHVGNLGAGNKLSIKKSSREPAQPKPDHPDDVTALNQRPLAPPHEATFDSCTN